MDITSIVAELRKEVGRIESAIAALEGTSSQATRQGRGSQAKTSGGRKRGHMSAAARARIGAAKKAWWAKQKGKAGPKAAKSTAKKSTSRKPMSPAMRKKLSAMMKARWAQKKKAA